MKKTTQKIMALFLMMVLLISSFAGTITATANTSSSTTYYVDQNGSDENDGTAALPVATIEKVIQLANAAGYDADDTVIVDVNGTVTWGGDKSKISANHEFLSEHEYKLVFTSQAPDTAVISGEVSTRMGGPVEFTDKVTIKINRNYYFGACGKNLVISNKFSQGVFDFTIGSGSSASTINNPFNIDLNTHISKIWVGSTYGTTTYNNAVTLNLNSSTGGSVIMQLGHVNNGSAVTFNDAFNLNVNGPSTLTFSVGEKVTLGNNGYVQILNNNPTSKISATSVGITNTNKLWVLNNAGANKLSTTSTAGVFEVAEGYTAKAYPLEGEPILSNDGVLTLEAGEYEVTFNSQSGGAGGSDEPIENIYEDFIFDRGNGLKNTFAKLNKGEKINVLYMGGSVTNGTGSTSKETTSWRGIISNWFVENAGNGRVNNVNVAYGDTCSLFGSYRLNAEILPENPDLIFVEFSINDIYNSKKRGYTIDDAVSYLETIIRGIRTKLPECDIVTTLITDKNSLDPTKLHSFAQAHENLSIAYDIPSLHIGRALAKEIQTTGNQWNYYSGDSVHPNDYGYAIYGGVVKEYLRNQKIANADNETVTNHTMPEMISDKLLDGNIQFIDADQALITASEKLGGTGFAYSDGATNLNNSGTDIFKGGVFTKNESDVLVVEFTGSELSMIEYQPISGFLVSVDNGNYVTINRDGVKPKIIADGLEYGKHTVRIKPIFSDKSTSFHIQGFFTRDVANSTHKHKYDKYFYNDDATCNQNGTETAKCSICGIPNTREIANSKLAHKYSNACDKICNICKLERTVPAHIYDNVCDAFCNECEEERVVPEHQYSSVCDTHCDVCDTLRANTSAHTYTNDCDADCNFCGETRTVGAHKYSNSCDTTCNYCNATRTITHAYKTTTTKATLTKNGSVIKKCSICGKVASNTDIKYAKTFKLSTAAYTYNGKVKTPTVTVKDSAGKTLKKNTDYTVTYASGRKNVGTYKVTIKMKGKYSGTKTLTFKINPAKTTVSKLTAGKKRITVAITKKSTQVTGYQIQYSTSKKFTSAKTKTITSYRTTKYTLKSLSAKKTYYVRVRTYKTVGKTKYYSGWSTYKYVRTK